MEFLENNPIVVPIGIVLFIIIFMGLRIVQEYQRAVVFRLGRYSRTGGPGLFWIIPFLEYSRTVDVRTITEAIEPQETITRDSVTIKVNAVVWYKVTSPSKATIAVRDFNRAVNQASLTSLRNVIGQHDLDEILRERDKINAQLKKIVDTTTEPWGVEIEAIEMKDVEIPSSMQRAMAQEAEAAREKRARIIKAEAELEASVKLAQASEQIVQNPAALELRRMQMISEVGAEHNSTTVILMPSDFVSLAGSLNDFIANNVANQKKAAGASNPPQQRPAAPTQQIPRE
ncbi:MAG: slipin family protein [Chloroflexi bacterium]|nr:slipin family protein [Chloroflexota bacterium]MCC6894768.1 slipin family protein [Anaerolineae bacterium]